MTQLSAFDDRPMEDLTVGRMLRNRAEVLGSKSALCYGPDDRDVSYTELDETGSAIANELLGMGVSTGTNVSVLFKNPLQTLFAMFGINKAGAVYSPVNFEYEGSALAYQLNDTDPAVLFVEDRYVSRLNAITADLDARPTVVVAATDSDASGDELDDAFESRSFADLREGDTTPPAVDVEWDDPASIVYTSGTTGMPKGVVIPHRWIFANYTTAKTAILGQDDVVHSSLPLYHIGGVYADVLAALIVGGSAAIWDRFSPTEFWDRIETYDATSATLLSVMMPWLAKPPEQGDDNRNTLNKVHMQPLPEKYESLARRFGFDIVTVAFAQTETGAPIVGVVNPTDEETETPRGVRRGRDPAEVVAAAEDFGLPVVAGVEADRYMGKPREDIVEVAVLNDRDEKLPPGEPGELAVRPKQPSLFLDRYHAKPERTLEATTNLWFHTGDMAYRDEEDNFYFVDRAGDVIRRRGENISSMQIQDELTAMAGVAQSAVFPIDAEEGGEDRIGAAIEPADGADPTDTDVQSHLDSRLPEFMHPDRVWIVDEIPTTETNKIEKYKLRDSLLEDN